jgi:diaminopropionate ammonia-lyase
MTSPATLEMTRTESRLVLNRLSDHGTAIDPADAAAFGPAAADEAEALLRHWPEFAPTPLMALPALANELDVGRFLVKDEGHRFGIGSFKSLGGAYAVLRLALERAEAALGRTLTPADLNSAEARAALDGMVVTTATDGNHGRSVAWGAQKLGIDSVIFVHERVSQARADIIASFGAKVIRRGATFDDAVEEVAKAASENGWTLVADTASPGYERIPALVMQGYTVLIKEAVEAMREPPTHVFVQAGVGGLAAALAAWLDQRLGATRPKFIVVEPDQAACLYASAIAGKATRAPVGEVSVMAMLECFEPSLVAWRILSRVGDAFMTVGDADAIAAMNRLARPAAGDPPIVAGESGCASVAGAICATTDPSLRSALGIDGNSRILAINTEGATDPARYRELVGADAAAIGESR